MYHELCRRYDALHMIAHTLLWVLAACLVLVGLAGTLLPALPGIPLMLIGMGLAAWIDDFARVGPWTLLVLAVLTLLSIVLDFAAAALGARRAGASRMAMLGAAVGTVAGLFLGLPGLLLGPLVGALVGELLAQGRPTRTTAHAAARIGIFTWVGFAVGMVAKLAIAFAMLGVFALAWFVD
jgi:uncharacterized protein YqgC (DUF456 family)